MNESLSLLQQANNEIKSLRRQNELMSARLNMFDSIQLLLRTSLNYPNQGMSEDLCWKIDQHINDETIPKTEG